MDNAKLAVNFCDSICLTCFSTHIKRKTLAAEPTRTYRSAVIACQTVTRLPRITSRVFCLHLPETKEQKFKIQQQNRRKLTSHYIYISLHFFTFFRLMFFFENKNWFNIKRVNSNFNTGFTGTSGNQQTS